jgi:hypothetical protein
MRRVVVPFRFFGSRQASSVRVVMKNADRKGKVVELNGAVGSTLLETAWDAKLDSLEGLRFEF